MHPNPGTLATSTPAASAVTAAADPQTAATAAHAFIAKWRGVTASELATAQSFVIDLCDLLGQPRPHATPEQDYMFERPITFAHGDGSTSPGRVDCYRRGHFVWESKKLKAGIAAQATGSATTQAFDDALLKARTQAENYARALPAAEGRPPFVVVVDVGHVIELYAEFTRSGATYTPFPDPRSHRIRLDQLADPAIRARLTALWTDPLSLDPSRVSAKVTRAVAAELAELAKSLEAAGHAPQAVAAFLTRCLFSMFAEDVGLLPQANPSTGAEEQGSFVHLLRQYREQPATLVQMLKVFWQAMDAGGFNAAIAQDVLRFNGKLFKGAGADGYVLPLTTAQIDGLLRAARANWQEVEPAIFGTLLERALDPTERHALGAHYTPRAYVERLVLPTVVEPLRADWAHAQAAAVLLAREADELTAAKDAKKREAKLEEARAEVRRFHHQLCTTRVLDPACGSGNFLYVTLEHLKRLEGEVLNQLEQLGERQDKLGLEGETVTLQQLRGIELNGRAAALAELVLWIGWLQWHVRTRGLASVAEPVVHDYRNIEHRDAVLAYDTAEPALDADGKAITRWDGVTFKQHPVTGEDVPDETAQVPQWKYVNPRPAEWPAADFIVGNPPFIGARRVRALLGDGYVDTLRKVYREVPDTADFVCYWWAHAAEAVVNGQARRFGLITTNSIVQAYSRPVLDRFLQSDGGLSLSFAVADHPWVTDGAAVRVALTVGVKRGAGEAATLAWVEKDGVSVEDLISRTSVPRIGSLLTAEVDGGPQEITPLRANASMCYQGVVPAGDGFKLDVAGIEQFRANGAFDSKIIRPYALGKDLVQRAEQRFIIDLFGYQEAEARSEQPYAFQHLLNRVKPERDHNSRASYRDRWWLFAESRPAMREALTGLRRYIGTPYTAKFRPFVFIDGQVIPDAMVYAISSEDALTLGVLSSCLHEFWCKKFGGTLEDRPRYNSKATFFPFPFPHDDTGLKPALADRIRQLAEQLDAHRKARQAAHEAVTLTGLYNVLDKLRRGEALNAKDKALHEQGLVSVLQSLHDELDAAVLAAYGWSDLGPVPWSDDTARAAWTESLLERLVALNARRAAEEAAGTVRWLRPEFQDPARRVADTAAPATQPVQTGLDGVETPAAAEARAVAADAVAADAGSETSQDGSAKAAVAAPAAQPWPPTLPEQMRAVAQLLAASPAPLPLAAIEAAFKGKGPWKKGLPRILETLEALGRAQLDGGGWRG